MNNDMIDNMDPNISINVGPNYNPFTKMATERNEYERKDMLH